MEPMRAVTEGEWGSLSGMYTSEEADFMAQLLNSNASLPNELTGDSSLGVPSTFWPGHESNTNVEGLSESSYYSSYMAHSNFYSFSPGSSYNGGNSSQQSYCLNDSQPILASNESTMSMEFCMVDVKNPSSFLVEVDDSLNQEKSVGNEEESAGKAPAAVIPEKDLQRQKESEMASPEAIPEENCSNPPENSKKRSRSSGDVSMVINCLTIKFLFV